MDEQSAHSKLKELEYHGQQEYEDTVHIFSVFKDLISYAQTIKDKDRIRDHRLQKTAVTIIRVLLHFVYEIKELDDDLRDKIYNQITNGLASIETIEFDERIQTIPDENYKNIYNSLKNARLLAVVLKHRIKYFTVAGLYYMYGKGLWMAMNIFNYYGPKRRDGLKYCLIDIKKFIDGFY